MPFIKDLKDGENAENELVGLLNDWGWSCGKNSATSITEKRFYDIWIQRPLLKLQKKTRRPVFCLEVKFDRKVRDTKNVYFEHETVENSRADYFVYKLDSDNQYYMAAIEMVRSIIDNPHFKQVKGGDSWGPGTLVPIETFKQIFIPCEEALK